MQLETELARKTFGDLYRGNLEEGIVLIKYGQKSEITADQLQNVILARMLGFGENKPLPENFLANEYMQNLFYRVIWRYDEVLAAQSRDFPAGAAMHIHPYNFRGIPFREGVDFQTNTSEYTTSRDLMARMVFHELYQGEKDGTKEPPKVEIKGTRGVETIKL